MTEGRRAMGVGWLVAACGLCAAEPARAQATVS
jgi:hypothetical protein